MDNIERKIAVGLIISADGKIFQGQKDPKKGGVYSDGEWHIPGGGVEGKETIEQALIREISEEAGLDVSNLSYELIDDAGKSEAKKVLANGETVNVKMSFYVYKIVLATLAKDTPVKLKDDIYRYRWTDIAELKDLKLTPPSVVLFKKLGYLK